jgi:hypothetical protein
MLILQHQITKAKDGKKRHKLERISQKGIFLQIHAQHVVQNL